MLNAILKFSLRQRVLIAAVSLVLLIVGGWQVTQLPIDVFPDLNRPRVVIMTEAPGMAPEEVEALITFPMETSLSGASGVQAVRSSSGVGLSVIYVEFDWGTDIFSDRQIVNERLATVMDELPQGVKPHLAPISSIMGQISMFGMYSEGNQTPPMELRTLADWVVRRRLLTIPGVSQVFVMGGGRKQFQVLVDPDLLLQYDVTLEEVKDAVRNSNQNTSGGYLDEQGPHELLVRALGRIQTLEELRSVVVKPNPDAPTLLSQVAIVKEAPQVKRGDSSAYQKIEDEDEDSNKNTEGKQEAKFGGGPAIVLTINKQPGADTRKLSEDLVAALQELKPSLPPDVKFQTDLYQQKKFIDLAIANVLDALRDGSILVVIILFLFLLNFRTTLITLTAIPLSIVVAGLVFAFFGLSINTMTLGGLAVAMGELVDDAIVDVENCLRRLRENSRSENPKSHLVIVYESSVEIRNSIVFGTIIVVLVFLPLFALSGMEGILFQPLGIAYIVSILASLLISLTLTPVMCYWLLKKESLLKEQSDGWVLASLKKISGWAIGFSLKFPAPILMIAFMVVCGTVLGLVSLERDFLPPFNEGAVQINVLMPPGTSQALSNEVAGQAEQRILSIEGVQTLVRKTGRAELDEHAEGVNVTEFVATLDPKLTDSREEIINTIRHELEDIPGIVTSVEQPLAHLISHMLSGVKAQVAIKIFGDDLTILRRNAEAVKQAISNVEGVVDLQVEQQVLIPQWRIELDSYQLKRFGLQRNQINELIETAMQGEVVSQVLVDQRQFDLVVRFDEKHRENLEALKRLRIDLPSGGTTKLESVAHLYRAAGPNTVNRENGRRRIVVQCNTAGRGLVDVVQEIQAKLKPLEEDLPVGYFFEFGGQFESQQSATRVISILFIVSLLGMFLVLFLMFRSVNLAVQVMVALPMAFIGAVAALFITHQTLTIASIVGFISLCGIAARNGILLINHYLHLVAEEGESWTEEMIIRAGQERVAPVLMTALTSGIGLVPLALAAGEPGKEILYPVATVIIGGLIASTILEFFVRPALFWSFGIKSAKRAVRTMQAHYEDGLD